MGSQSCCRLRTSFPMYSSELLRLASKRESTFSSQSFVFTALQLSAYLLSAIASCLYSIREQNSHNLQPFGNSILFAVVLAIQSINAYCETLTGLEKKPDSTLGQNADSLDKTDIKTGIIKDKLRANL